MLTLKNNLIISLSILVFISLFSSLESFAGTNEQKVTLQLFWKHQFEFAGYYAAQEKGFYREAGLSVGIQEYQFGMDVNEEVLSGRADFATVSSSATLNYLQGKQIKLLANIFKHSALVLLSHRDAKIRTPDDLHGKRLMLTSQERKAVELLSFFRKTGIDTDKLEFIEHNFDPMAIANGHADVMSAYITNQPYVLQEWDIPFNIMDPVRFGVDFYGDSLITSAELAEQKPDVVDKFRQASLKGWEYALQHPDEIVELILNKYNTQEKSREALLYEADQTAKLILTETYPLGSVDPQRINRIAEAMMVTGVIDKKPVIDSFLFDNKHSKQIALTVQELAWIKFHTVSVGVEQWDPVVFSNNSLDIDGIAGDILKQIIKVTGLKTKIINDRWNTLLNDFKDKRIDILPATYYTDERASYGLYSTDYFKMKDYIYVKEDNNSIYSMSDLEDKKLAIVEGYGTIDKIKEKFPSIQLVYTKDLDDSINQVLNGSVEALYEGQIAVEKKINEELISGLKGIAQVSFKAPGLHLFSRIDEPLLNSILQKGLDSITQKERHQITLSWIDEFKSSNIKATLTDEEKSWINSNTVTVGIEPWAPISYYENAQANGLSGDILNLVIEKTGLKVELVNQSWNELINGFKEKKIDLLPDAYYTEERQQYGLFSQPYFTLRENIYIKENNKSIQSFEDLSHKSIAIVRGFATIPAIKKHYPDIKVIETDDFMQSVQLVLNGQSDALLESRITSEYFFQEHGIYNLKGIPQFSLKGNKLHFLSRFDQPILQSILQKGLDAISRQEKKEIVNQWISQDNTLNLNDKEQDWIDKKRPIRYVYNPDWAPFEWTNEVGQHAGFISDVVRLLKAKSGLNLHHIPTKSWAEATQKVKDRSVDMYSAVGVTEERKAYMNFSDKTLFSTPYVLVSREGENYTQGFEHFNKTNTSPHKLAVVGNYTIHGIMEKNLPEIPLILLNGTEEGFEKLLSKEIDVFLVNKVTAKYFLQQHAYKQMQIAYKTDYQLNLHVAVRNDWPAEVLSIIDKTIATFNEEDLYEIYKKWTKVSSIPTPLDYGSLNKEISELSFAELLQLEEMLFAAFVVLLLAYFIYQNYSRSKFLNIRFNHFILLIVGFEFIMILFIIYELMVLDRLENSLATVYLDKFEMLKTVDKLRQSSDDLSHYARSYAVTSNLQYKQNYLDILDIRNGIKARPKNYDAIYWDLSPELRKHHHPDGEKIMLKALIANLPYSKQELELLKQSEDNSNDLVSLEVKAFKAMQEKNQPLAIELLHSQAYYQAKVIIMHPLDDLFSSINHRSNTKIILLEKNISNAFRAIMIASILFVLGNFIIYLMLVKKIRQPLSYLIDTILQIKSGSEAIEEKTFYSDELGTMNSEFFSMRKLIQEQMDEQIRSEAKTRSIINNASDGIIVINQLGIIQLFSPSAEKIFHYQSSEVIGKNVKVLMPEPFYTEHDGYLERYNKSHKKHIVGKSREVIGKRKDGTQFPMDLAVGESITGEESLFTGIIRDISDRKKDQDALIQAEEKTRLLLTSVGEGIFGVGSDGLVNFINPAALQMLQYHESEILGQKIHAIIHHTHADGTAYPVEECPMYHAFSEGKISHIDNEVLWRKDGSCFPVEYRAFPVFKDNQISGSVVTFSDITERKKASDLLLKQQQEIREINKQTRESIEYAALIQGALVPDNKIFQKYFQDYFAIWHPKDIVGGDIYLLEALSEDEVVLMVIDCTGHGVPGAFVTMLVKAVERQLTANLNQDKTISPAKMLSIFNKSIKHLLQQEDIDSISNAGFDGGILYYNKKEKIIRFAGANTPLFLIQNNELKTIKGDRHSIGYKKSDADYMFIDHTIDVSSSTQVYMTTDGYLDQNGGKKGFPYGKKRFTQFILENADEQFADQQELLLYELQKYEGTEERNDDVTVIGFKI